MATEFEINRDREQAKLDALLTRKNRIDDRYYNGIFDRYVYPVVTREMVPLFWKYDMNPETNPHFMERLGVNCTFNSGAIKLNGKYYLVVRVEGADRKSFFAVAESDTGIDGFRFWDYPIQLEDTCPDETNVYDMRLTQHEDGWIYGVFCSESKDKTNPDLSAAVAAAGIVRTKDLKTWERLPNLVTLHSPQQRNVVLHPEFVNGKYAFYTRPMDSFIDTGSGGGIGFGLCDDITHAVIDEEKILSRRKYHQITEAKNGECTVPIKTEKGQSRPDFSSDRAALSAWAMYRMSSSPTERLWMMTERSSFTMHRAIRACMSQPRPLKNSRITSLIPRRTRAAAFSAYSKDVLLLRRISNTWKSISDPVKCSEMKAPWRSQFSRD